MNKSRLESFTDAVLAISMTLMVIGIVAPLGNGFGDLWGLKYQFFVYTISFFTLAIYWKNHHYLLAGERRISGRVITLNIILVFLLTLFPFVTAWVGVEYNIYALAPELTFGIVLLLSNICFTALDLAIARADRSPTVFSTRRTLLTLAVNVVSLALCFIFPPAVLIGRVIILAMWAVPPKKMRIKGKAGQ
jgi:uncharacterized membrane protein